MKKKLLFFGLIPIFVISCADLTACGETEYVRDMSEVASRGSFIFQMGNDWDKFADVEDTLVFNTYEEFCESSFSDVVLYQSGHTNDKKEWVTEYYKAKNERYNADYFEENSLLVAFFEIDYAVSEQIVRNVTMSGNTCSIDVIQYRRTTATASGSAVHACFIETKQELSYETVAEVSVETFTFSADTSLFCYFGGDSIYDMLDADSDDVTAYYIPSRSALESFIDDNEYIVENGITQTVMKGKYSEEFFEEYALLFIQLPGEYRGLVEWNGGALQGLRFDSDHYVTKYLAEIENSRLEHTAISMVAVPKNIDPESFTYSFRSYSEWEEGVTANNVQSDEITLVRTENEGKDYVTYLQA